MTGCPFSNGDDDVQLKSTEIKTRHDGCPNIVNWTPCDSSCCLREDHCCSTSAAATVKGHCIRQKRNAHNLGLLLHFKDFSIQQL